ncbi:hypothetical protein HU200_014398 [Digitaria exilis]|uniref:Uncharacterized protein n=1 Tax=Digitaria exilis TaxID=1010633 RepID=A0A835KIW0_9POAL|nr:hypothetical protein HU200_014398 [Digitaria exilis]
MEALSVHLPTSPPPPLAGIHPGTGDHHTPCCHRGRSPSFPSVPSHHSPPTTQPILLDARRKPDCRILAQPQAEMPGRSFMYPGQDPSTTYSPPRRNALLPLLPPRRTLPHRRGSQGRHRVSSCGRPSMSRLGRVASLTPTGGGADALLSARVGLSLWICEQPSRGGMQITTSLFQVQVQPSNPPRTSVWKCITPLRAPTVVSSIRHGCPCCRDYPAGGGSFRNGLAAGVEGHTSDAVPRATAKLPLQNPRFRMMAFPGPQPARAAADMRRAIIVSAFGDHPPLTPEEIKATPAGRFGLDQASLEAKRAARWVLDR